MRSLLVLALAGCGSDPAMQIDAAPAGDATVDSPAALTWETVTPVSDDGQVIVEDVTYRSEGLLIRAHLCRPAATGPHGVLVYNHGGFQGLQIDPEVQKCVATAQFGYVWLGSSYRGEDGSEGKVEVCLGEVTDVLELIRVATAQPYVDPAHVVMYGGSHGGCITQRAVQRGAPVLAAVDIFGPTDWATLYQFWQSQPQTGIYPLLIQTMNDAVGGGPDTHAAAYMARSPLHFPFPESVPLLVTQGTDDAVVPPVQSCQLAPTRNFTSWHVDNTGAVTASVPTGCTGTGVPSTTDPRPTNVWAGTRYMVVYDGLGHETSSAAATRMLQDAAYFLMDKLN